MILRSLRLADEEQAVRAHHELATDNFEFLLKYFPDMPWAEYVELLDNEHRGIDLPEGRVPATFMVADVDGEIVGRTSIRHELNDFLLHVGGHIGYGVRPGFRRRGYATEILKQSLAFIRDLGVKQVLVTCDDDNVGSIAVIESQGGILENKVPFEGTLRRRYWIN